MYMFIDACLQYLTILDKLTSRGICFGSLVMMGVVVERVTVIQVPHLVRFCCACLELTNRTDQVRPLLPPYFVGSD